MMKKMKLSTSDTALLDILQKFYPWILFVAIAILVWLLAQAFWLVIAPPTAPRLTPVPLQSNTNTQNNTGNALDIFAQPQTAQAQAAPPPDIKVLGVTVASPEQYSYAIINSNGKIQNYRVHDTIEGSNYVLTAVKSDYIMVSNGGGQPIKIQFGQPFPLDQSDAIRAKLAQANGSNTNQNFTPNVNTSTPPTVGTTDNPFAVPNTAPTRNGDNDEVPPPNSTNTNGSKSAITGAVTGLEKNPSGYLSQMGVSATGQGYLVTEGMPAGLKNRLGLQAGDKVLSVNGQMVGQNPAQDAQLLKEVQQSGQAQIQVQRGDQTVTVKQSF